MKNPVLLAVIAFAVLVGGVLFLSRGGNSVKNVSQENNPIAAVNTRTERVILHKSPTCGCCGVYGNYLNKLGYDVEIHDTNNLGEVKTRLGVPREVESCHTLEVAGYVVEGHVPEEAIRKLLDEKPDSKGIGMGGMPSGSPGMPGSKSGSFVIYEITHEGTRGDVFLTI